MILKQLKYWIFLLNILKVVFTMKMFKFQLMLNVLCPGAFKLKGTMRVLQFHVFVLQM